MGSPRESSKPHGPGRYRRRLRRSGVDHGLSCRVRGVPSGVRRPARGHRVTSSRAVVCPTRRWRRAVFASLRWGEVDAGVHRHRSPTHLPRPKRRRRVYYPNDTAGRGRTSRYLCSGLFYNVFRYYNPDTGRYLSPDPLGLAPAPNNYTYPSNPTVVCDPLGLDPGLGTAAGHVDKTDNYLPGLPRDVQPLLGRGSTGAVVPNNLLEQLAMESARADPCSGKHLEDITIGDGRWQEPGWAKYQMSPTVHSPLGFRLRVTIHYLVNRLTGEIDDFKFIEPKW